MTTSRPPRARSLQILKWVTAIIPALAIYMAETIRHDWIEPYIPANVYGNLAIGVLAFCCTFAFSTAIFRIIDGMQAELVRRNAELAAVNEFATEAVLMLDSEAIAGRTRALIEALYPSATVTVALDEPLTAGDVAGASGRGLQPLPGRASTPFPARAGQRLSATLQTHRGAIGSIAIDRPEREFETAETRLLQLVADTSAMAIENALLLKELRSTAIADERHWLAREMHDGLGQLLASMLVQIDIVEALASDRQNERAIAALGGLRATAEQANAEIRAEIASLRLLAELDRDFFERLETFVGDFEDQTGIVTDLVVDRDRGATLPPEVGLQLIRIIQESLANVRKHAGASLATVRLTVRPDAVRLDVEDDGGGFDPAEPAGATARHFGLKTMSERAASLGGELRVESTIHRGTRLSALIPLQRSGAFAHAGPAAHDRGRPRAVS